MVYRMPILIAQDITWEFYSLLDYLLKERESNNNYIVAHGGLYIRLCATQVVHVQPVHERTEADLAEISSCCYGFGQLI